RIPIAPDLRLAARELGRQPLAQRRLGFLHREQRRLRLLVARAQHIALARDPVALRGERSLAGPQLADPALEPCALGLELLHARLELRPRPVLAPELGAGRLEREPLRLVLEVIEEEEPAAGDQEGRQQQDRPEAPALA